MLKERLLLLEIGETLGYPRLAYGRTIRVPHDKRISQGKEGWEKFCSHAHASRLPAALRLAKVLRDNGTPKFHPLTGREMGLVEDILIGAIAVRDNLSPTPRGISLVDDIEPATTILKPLTKEQRRAANKAAWAARPRGADGKRRKPQAS
jgi:hypothetical protein